MRHIWLFVPVLLLAQETPPGEGAIPKQNPYTSEADVARGKRLYMGQCAACHGPGGDGGRGTNLARPNLPRAADDQSLFRILRNGIEGTEMPGAWILTDRERWQVAAFVRTLGRTATAETIPGDADRGRALYTGKGKCQGCHTIRGEGGRLGPVLTEVGSRRSARFLREKLIDSSTGIAEDFVRVAAVTRGGQRVTGVRLNEDTFSIQVRDLTDNLHSLWKSDLAELKKDTKTSPMPSFGSALSAAELDDMVAYLVSLRGEKK